MGRGVRMLCFLDQVRGKDVDGRTKSGNSLTCTAKWPVNAA